MTLTFTHTSQSNICSNNKFGGFDAKQVSFIDNGIETTIVSFEVDNLNPAMLLATFVEDLQDWGDLDKELICQHKIEKYIDMLIESYEGKIDDYINRDDWDDYFVTMLQVQAYFKQGIITEDMFLVALV